MAGEELDKFMVDEPDQQQSSESSSSSAEVKQEVKQDSGVPLVDEKGVPYFNRFKEMSERFKDVDPDKWAKLKDFDPDRVSKALELEEFLTKDRDKFEKALALYEERKEEEQESKSGEPKYLTADDFNKLMQQREQEAVRGQWMNEWRRQVDSSMSTALKNESFKDFGDLHDRDKKAVMQEVGEVFEKDAQSRNPKLSLNDVPKIVNDVVKSLYDYRLSIRGQAVKKDASPQSISGNRGTEAQKKPEGEYDENEETKDMINLYKELSNPHI